MQIGRLEIYTYRGVGEKFFVNLSNDDFYGEDRVFRYDLSLFGVCMVINYYKKDVDRRYGLK